MSRIDRNNSNPIACFSALRCNDNVTWTRNRSKRAPDELKSHKNSLRWNLKFDPKWAWSNEQEDVKRRRKKRSVLISPRLSRKSRIRVAGEKKLRRFTTLLNFLRCEQRTNDEMIKIKTVIEEQLRLQPSQAWAQPATSHWGWQIIVQI